MIKTIDTENITTELIECAYMLFTAKPSKKDIQSLLEAAPAVEPAQAVPVDDDTRKRVLELCTAAQEHVSVWTYPYGKQTLELAKQIRERLEAGE